MSGEEFENYLSEHFRKIGYRVKLTPKSNDYGADLVLRKGGEKIVVQAKRYQSKVSNKAIQEIVGALGYYNAQKAMVVTNSYFTKNACDLARANGVELWDRNVLINTFSIRQ
jgi:restriction system protein